MPPSSHSTTRPLIEIASDLGLDSNQIEPFGWHAGKVSIDLHEAIADRPKGKFIGVTAINPTPFGEGKTVVSIGLAMAMNRIGKRTIVNLRQPSLAPVFGIKGGGAGAGACHLVPAQDINVHFTGDLHAVAAANNLLAALADNHAARKKPPVLPKNGIIWRRVLDMNDKGLARIELGLDEPIQCLKRETGFDLTAASEVMSVLSLASNLSDLRTRLQRIMVGVGENGEPVTASHLGAGGAMTALLRNAIRPNLVQTCEGTPAIVHGGPFANISHGNNSVIADLTAIRLADYVVTESGFGSDLGAEKLFNIKSRASGIVPDAEVIVCTLRALKYHSGKFDVRPGRPLPSAILSPDRDALEAGFQNLLAHIDNVQRFGIPVVVAINRFPEDGHEELAWLKDAVQRHGMGRVEIIDAFSRGGLGGVDLAAAVVDACDQLVRFQPTYELEDSYEVKLDKLARNVYGADRAELSQEARESLQKIEAIGAIDLPVCVAKTQYSMSHDPKLLGHPKSFVFPVHQIRLLAGAGFVLAIADGISLMPGLPKDPAASRIDVDANGNIIGL